MPLTTAQRERAREEATAWLEENEIVNLDKPALRAALDAAIGWIETGAVRVSYNAALPEPFRSTASDDLKALALMYAIKFKYDLQV